MNIIEYHRHKLAEKHSSREFQFQPYLLKSDVGQILGADFLCQKSPGVPPHYTYPSNHLKVLLPAEINGFSVEKPLKDGTQGRITGHLAWQHEALSHIGIQTQGWNYNLCRLYSIIREKRENKLLLYIALYLYKSQPNEEGNKA